VDNKDAELRTLRVFLSYSHKDRYLAGEFKVQLENYGFEVFLAHEDIEPLSEWQDEIISSLKDCDIFIPIISKNFKESNWTDQETGFALAREILIIPIMIDLSPYGFIGKLQALKPDDAVSDSCEKIIEIIKNSPLSELLTNCFIRSFVNSETFYQANDRADLLQEYEPFNDDQINELVRGYIINDQISGGFRAKPFVKRMFEKYSDVIKPELKEKFEEFV